ncbi:MAG TPA: hypothetical protein VGJ73_09640 [Verrucomicrobiae bacterium]|jgi:hypothetical protein
MKTTRILGPAYITVFLPVMLVLTANRLYASVLWNESVNGSLSASGSSPTALSLSDGVNAILGTVGGSAQQDWVALTVPTGFQLSSLVLASYTSTDAQGFMGVQVGPSFTGSVNSASSWLGYTHFGTGAANGSLPPTDLVGVDLLPIMGNNIVDSPGSQGFTPPLNAGTYTFLIQQLGANTAYEFDFGVTTVPEPSPAALVCLASGICITLAAVRRRRPAVKGRENIAA